MTAQQEQPGYDDTPVLPGSTYRVHDKLRPHARVVTPGTASTREQAGRPPSDAVVLFDGRDGSAWQRTGGGDFCWKVENGYMQVVPKSGSIETKEPFGDCQLHLEWMAPSEVTGDSQGRGNSGVFLMGLYEIQVLDCYDNPTYADGATGAIYGQCPPLVNPCRRPGEWQVYDIVWEGPRFEGEKLMRPAYATVVFNGVLIHNHTELLGQTRHKVLPSYEPHPRTGPLMLQDHNNPVRFRNIWYRELKDYDQT